MRLWKKGVWKFIKKKGKLKDEYISKDEAIK